MKQKEKEKFSHAFVHSSKLQSAEKETMNSRSRRREYIEDIVIIAGLVGLQFIYAGNSVLLSYLMSLGFTTGSLVILNSLATFVMLSPFTVIFERELWPRTFSWKLWMKLVLASFGGVTLCQPLLLKGINLTSPAMGTAMPNLAPAFIFFIAWIFRFLFVIASTLHQLVSKPIACESRTLMEVIKKLKKSFNCNCRLEKVEIGCIYSRAKIVGMLFCVTGAIVMSLVQSSSMDPRTVREAHVTEMPQESHHMFDQQKIVGCMYLMVAVLLLSSTIILQATILSEFPAPMSLTAITSLIGMILTGLVQLIQNGRIDTAWPLLSFKNMIWYSLVAGTISGICVSFNTWAMKKRGPVLVSIFNPIGTVVALILSVITLGKSFTSGSIVGMSIMFAGLYTVLWVKEKEKFSSSNIISSESEYDVEKPLLS